MDKMLWNEMNEAYQRLEEKKAEIIGALKQVGFEVEFGWYNGHYRRGEDGTWQRESFPIPVIGAKGLCDVELSFDGISVSTKLKREKALACSYDRVASYEFEAFGVEDYLADFFHAGQTIIELKQNISKSDEREIGFAFSFPLETEGKALLEFAILLQKEGFYD